MARKHQDSTVDPALLDLGYLALFVGMRVNERVLTALHDAGFKEIRMSHGFVFQHLMGGPLSVGELARRMEVTQQAASKTAAELTRLGLLEDAPSTDLRVRRLRMTARAVDAVEKTRALRQKEMRALTERHGKKAVERTRLMLAHILEDLGGVEAVASRRVRAST